MTIPSRDLSVISLIKSLYFTGVPKKHDYTDDKHRLSIAAAAKQHMNELNNLKPEQLDEKKGGVAETHTAEFF